jgi:hypothetical protein
MWNINTYGISTDQQVWHEKSNPSITKQHYNMMILVAHWLKIVEIQTSFEYFSEEMEHGEKT